MQLPVHKNFPNRINKVQLLLLLWKNENSVLTRCAQLRPSYSLSSVRLLLTLLFTNTGVILSQYWFKTYLYPQLIVVIVNIFYNVSINKNNKTIDLKPTRLVMDHVIVWKTMKSSVILMCHIGSSSSSVLWLTLAITRMIPESFFTLTLWL